jgi:hypothetical protein
MKKIDFKDQATKWKIIKWSALIGAGFIGLVGEFAETKGNEISVREEAKDFFEAMTTDAIRKQMEDVAKEECSKQLVELINEMAKNK